jgi:nucleotide-binding universal stress UspA family protein
MSGLEEGAAQGGERVSGAPPANVIVIGIDGSSTSWDAFWWACGETRRLCGRAVAVFVESTSAAGAAAAFSPFAGGAMAFLAVNEAESAHAQALRTKTCGYARDHGIDLTFVHARGNTAKELLRVAEADHADLIVVGASTKAHHHVAGSLGRRLIGKRHAPIIVVVP